MVGRSPLLAAALGAALVRLAAAGDIFAHYMVQGLDYTNTDHASQDIQDALALGFDGFALNVGAPGEGWNDGTVGALFDAAEAVTDVPFKLFFSMDLYQNSDPYSFNDLITQYASSDAYYKGGPNSLPMVSTFSAGDGSDPSYWPDWKSSLGIDIYFVPEFDEQDNYYENPSEWLSSGWGDVVDGLFSWETSWPGTSDTHANVSTSSDEAVMSAIHATGKEYMIPLSSLQYKRYDGQYWFRVGDVNLPQRMTEILALSGDSRPDMVEVQTWNDAGESHYMGNIWPDGLDDTTLAYADPDEAGDVHTGWQPLFQSFIAAFHDDDNAPDASGMRPQNGADVVGALWYLPLLQSATCASDTDMGGQKPSGSGSGLDTINWAVVVAEGVSGYKVQSWSDGTLLKVSALDGAGLHYGSDAGVSAGVQYVEVVDANDTIIISGQGAKDIAAEASGVCTYNFVVAGMS